MTGIGQNIKNFRRNKGFTLSELSKRSGLSVSYLSLLERDMNNPTLSSIQSICTALNISLAELFADMQNNRLVIRKNERQMLFSDHETVLYYSLSDNSWPMTMFTMEVLDNSEHISHKHVFTEMGTIIKGSMIFTINDISTEVFEGDSVLIPANSHHQFTKTSECECLSVWVQAPREDNADSEITE